MDRMSLAQTGKEVVGWGRTGDRGGDEGGAEIKVCPWSGKGKLRVLLERGWVSLGWVIQLMYQWRQGWDFDPLCLSRVGSPGSGTGAQEDPAPKILMYCEGELVFRCHLEPSQPSAELNTW